jgi:predicted ester cyclase
MIENKSYSHSEEVNKATVCRYLEEVVHRGNVAAVDESIATNHVIAWPDSPAIVRGSEGFRQLLIMYARAFPDLDWTTEEVSAEGGTVVVRLRVRGTQLCELLGMPPIGNQTTWTETHIFHVVGGRLVEHWGIIFFPKGGGK